MTEAPRLASVGLVDSDRDLEGILALQRESRAPTQDGFVTVEHTLDILRAMHALAPSVVARDSDGAIAGYAIVMPQEVRALLPILEPMFAMIERLPPAADGRSGARAPATPARPRSAHRRGR